ncbi:GNAT family N-acetyltransferase [Saccharomonospora piscinae]|uniref:GNAT family N-acetyltransferase n=1 Tax=Saccharomonospora piscinae TaxID=687388 RepID=A0A1V9ACR7_SACPI|nr:GNAT family N-acetyltransferase [Saccharomonospora piscinae]OQO94836.1 GNAT family N-acetyltransferase [Saccharomonospora piscinae]
MNDVAVRALRDDEFRSAHRLFRAALHAGPGTDEEWERVRPVFQPGRVLGAFDEQLVGTARSMDAELVVPGGARVPLAAVTGVGVRADRTRRGVLTGLMRTQLAELAGRGVSAATLYATEGPIYGRFGYGIAGRARSYTVSRQRARLRPDAPEGGRIEMLDLDEAERRLPEVYSALPLRPGMMSRDRWWPGLFAGMRSGDDPAVALVHHGADGPDGFALYRVSRDSGMSATLRVVDLHSGNATAFAGLWRFLLGVDLVDTVIARNRPLDEPVELLLTDPRACETTELTDETWLRLVDVEAALAARTWHGAPLVLEVTDPVLDHNTGRYRVGPDEVSRTDEPADAALGVAELAMIFAGGWLPSALVDAGRISVLDPGVAVRLDELARTRRAPWCGTFF